MESIRFASMDLRQNVDDVAELLETPKSIASDARSMSQTCDVAVKIANKAKSAAGPFGSAVVSAAIPAMQGLSKSTLTSAKSLDKLDKSLSLSKRAASVREWGTRIEKKVPFEKMQKINKSLAKLEKNTAEAGKHWPAAKSKLPAKAVTAVEKSLSSITSIVSSASGKLKDAAEAADVVDRASHKAHDVMTTYRRIKAAFQPAVKLMNWITEKVKWVLDKVFGYIMSLPIVKTLIKAIEKIANDAVEWFLKTTGLGKVFTAIADKCNPFKAVKDMIPQEVKQVSESVKKLVPNDFAQITEAATSLKLVSVKSIAPEYSGPEFLVPAAAA